MAAGATYTPIASNTVSGSTTSTVTFSSISSAYTDIVCVGNFGVSTSATVIGVRFNGDTSSNYSQTRLVGNGTSATSNRYSDTQCYLDSSAYVPLSITANVVMNIMNYANTTTYKTFLHRYNDAAGETIACVNLWRATPAVISSMTFLLSSGYFLSGSTFALYGIAAA